MNAIKMMVAAVLAALTLAYGSGAAEAETLTFRIKSSYEFKVQIAFYAQSRNHSWPGGDRAYNLDDSEVHSFPLSCQAGERICYGAWPTGDSSKSWGVGPNSKNNCSRCCYTCGDGDVTPVIELE